MKFKKWLNKLRKELRPLPRAEIEEAARYYNELFNDKRDSGMNEVDILIEFGSPEFAAMSIKRESVSTGRERRQTRREERREDTFVEQRRPEPTEERPFRHSDTQGAGFDRYEYHYIRDEKGAERPYKEPQIPEYRRDRYREDRGYEDRRDGYRVDRRYDEISKAKKNKSRSIAGTVLKVLLWIVIVAVMLIVTLSVWGAVVGLFVGGVATSIVGVVEIVVAVSSMANDGIWLAPLGAGLFLFGFGYVFASAFIKVAIALFKLTKKVCIATFHRI